MGTIFGAHIVHIVKVTWPATPIMMKNLVFSDYAMKITFEAPIYFSTVLSLKSFEST